MFELYFGANKYEAPIERVAIIDEFSANLRIFPFNTAIAKLASVIRYSLATDGKLIGPYDILIAATTLTHKLILVTGNQREFSRIEGLKTENWII